MHHRFQRHGLGALLLILTIVCAPWEFVLRLTQPPGTTVGEPVIRMSAFCAVLYWFFGAVLALRNYQPGRIEPWAWFRQRRAVWTVGCVFFLLHAAVAMHAGHAWSHGDAFRHTEEVGGVGAGIFVNYLFGAVWLGDVLWMGLAPNGYRSRPRWVGLAVHGFLAFVVFNATVVFATSPFARGVALLFTAWLVREVVVKWTGRASGRKPDVLTPTASADGSGS